MFRADAAAGRLVVEALVQVGAPYELRDRQAGQAAELAELLTGPALDHHGRRRCSDAPHDLVGSHDAQGILAVGCDAQPTADPVGGGVVGLVDGGLDARFL